MFQATCDVWNIGQTGVTTFQTPDRVISRTGAKQVSTGRGVLVTVACAASTSGNVIPPIICASQGSLQGVLAGPGPTWKCRSQQQKWLDAGVGYSFLLFLKHFVHYVRCSKEMPALLVLDNHAPHLPMEGLNFSRD